MLFGDALLALRCLVDRLRCERDRAEQLVRLRRRFRDVERRHARAGSEEIIAACSLREQKRRIAEALGSVAACSSCARGYPLPHGHWDGGYCCGTTTDQVFTDHEIAALCLSGAKPSRFSCPPGPLAGCVFRGPDGCWLSCADRPSICARYLCLALVRELRERGDLRRLDSMCTQLQRTFSGLVDLMAKRDEENLLREAEVCCASLSTPDKGLRRRPE